MPLKRDAEGAYLARCSLVAAFLLRCLAGPHSATVAPPEAVAAPRAARVARPQLKLADGAPVPRLQFLAGGFGLTSLWEVGLCCAGEAWLFLPVPHRLIS